MFSINKYGRNFKPGIPLTKDFRNEVIQMAEAYFNRSGSISSKKSSISILFAISAKLPRKPFKLHMFGYQACHVCAQLEHVFLPRVHA